MEADEKTLVLIEAVKKQRGEIAKAEKPNYKTNMSYPWRENDYSQSVNLNAENKVENLVKVLAQLTTASEQYNNVVTDFKIDAPKFTWGGFSLSDWEGDIIAKIAKVQISKKKEKLAALESRLNAIISPELRAQLELEAIERELNS